MKQKRDLDRKKLRPMFYLCFFRIILENSFKSIYRENDSTENKLTGKFLKGAQTNENRRIT